MIKVIDISFSEFISLSDRSQYDYYLKYGKFEPLDLFEVGNLTDCNFGFVKDVQESFNSGSLNWQVFIELISKHKSLTIKEISKKSLFRLYQSKLYLDEQIRIINKLESEKLSHNSTADEELAGLDVFSKYQSFLQFDSLANGLIFNFDKIRSLPYSVCFTKLLLEKDKAEFERRLLKIRTRKRP